MIKMKTKYRLYAFFAITLLVMILSVYSLTLQADEEARPNENITVTLYPDGTIGVKGTVSTVIPGEHGITGNAELLLKGAPKKLENNITLYTGEIDSSGDLVLKSVPGNISALSAEVSIAQDGGVSHIKIFFNIESVNTTGWVKLVGTSKLLDNGTTTVDLQASFDITHPLDEQTVFYIKKQIKQLQPQLINLALARSGMTFLKITKLDLSNITISTKGARGSAHITMAMSYKDYIDWIKGMMYAQGNMTENMNQTIKAIQKLYQSSRSPYNKIQLNAKVDLKGTHLTFSLKANGQFTQNLIEAYRDYLKLLPETLGTTGASPIKIPKVEETGILKSEEKTNLTLSAKPLSIKVEYQASPNKEEVKIIIDNLYLKEANAGIGYEQSLKALKELVKPAGEDVIEYLRIQVAPYNGEYPTINVGKEAQNYMVNRGENYVVFSNFHSDAITSLSLKNVPKVTTIQPTSTTETHATASTTTVTAEKTTTSTTASTSTPQTTTQRAGGASTTKIVGGIIVAIIVVAVGGFLARQKI